MLSDLSQSQDCGSQHKRYTCKQKVKLTDPRDPDYTHKMGKLVNFT